jgi:hypothetical protein
MKGKKIKSDATVKSDVFSIGASALLMKTDDTLVPHHGFRNELTSTTPLHCGIELDGSMGPFRDEKDQPVFRHEGSLGILPGYSNAFTNFIDSTLSVVPRLRPNGEGMKTMEYLWDRLKPNAESRDVLKKAIELKRNKNYKMPSLSKVPDSKKPTLASYEEKLITNGLFGDLLDRPTLENYALILRRATINKSLNQRIDRVFVGQSVTRYTGVSGSTDKVVIGWEKPAETLAQDVNDRIKELAKKAAPLQQTDRPHLAWAHYCFKTMREQKADGMNDHASKTINGNKTSRSEAPLKFGRTLDSSVAQEAADVINRFNEAIGGESPRRELKEFVKEANEILPDMQLILESGLLTDQLFTDKKHFDYDVKEQIRQLAETASHARLFLEMDELVRQSAKHEDPEQKIAERIAAKRKDVERKKEASQELARKLEVSEFKANGRAIERKMKESPEFVRKLDASARKEIERKMKESWEPGGQPDASGKMAPVPGKLRAELSILELEAKREEYSLQRMRTRTEREVLKNAINTGAYPTPDLRKEANERLAWLKTEGSLIQDECKKIDAALKTMRASQDRQTSQAHALPAVNTYRSPGVAIARAKLMTNPKVKKAEKKAEKNAGKAARKRAKSAGNET